MSPRTRLEGGSDLGRASWRLTVQFAALLLVILAVVAAVVFTIVSASVAEAAQRSLEAAAGLDSPEDAPEGTYLITVDDGRSRAPSDVPDGLVDEDALRSVAAGGDAVRSSRSVDGRDFLLLTTVAPGGRDGDRVVQVAIDQEENHEEMTRLASAFVVAGIVALVVSALASFVMARRAMRPLADALALQRRFVADASHELRTPLTVLSTRAQMLRRRGGEQLPPEVAGAVDAIVDDSRVLTGILDDLLIAADPRSVAEVHSVDLTRQADRAVDLLREGASSRGVELVRPGDMSPDDPGPLTVAGSDAALLRLVVALVTNAIDHARSVVTLSVRAEDGNAVLTVSDDGDGFAPGIADRAFERFSSGRGGEAAATVGNDRHYGLGLAIVAEIAQRHHGTVAIGPGPGGSVIVRIPLAG